jgi:hypothetical protein
MELADITVPRTRFPEAVRIRRELGRGANNRVYECEYEGADCVLRVPRRRSDTQQHGSAAWECRHTLRASELEAAPRVHAIWNARHAHGAWPSGLYVISERYPHDFDAVLSKADLRALAMEVRDQIGAQIVARLEALARDHMFVFDLKPSNLVLSGLSTGDPDVRIIDYGRDFCEWRAGAGHDRATPHIDMLRRRILEATPDAPAADVDARISHVLFCTMVVVLAATTTHQLRADRRENRTDVADRRRLNPMTPVATRLLGSMRGVDLSLMRHLLRMDEVRGVLRHYHGRRDAGTRRTLALAKGTNP